MQTQLKCKKTQARAQMQTYLKHTQRRRASEWRIACFLRANFLRCNCLCSSYIYIPLLLLLLLRVVVGFYYC